MASFKLYNDCVDDIKEPVDICAIFDNSYECNGVAKPFSAMQLLSTFISRLRLPTEKFHVDNENDVTLCDVTDNGSAIWKSKQNYVHVTNSSKAGVKQCNNSLRYRNRAGYCHYRGG